MIIGNVKINGRLCDIQINGTTIAAIEPAGQLPKTEFYDMGGRKAFPGLIDIHIHGRVGADTMDGDLQPIAADLARRGVTAWLPTTMTAPLPVLKERTAELPQLKGAQALGYHLEGPFLSPDHIGAQNRQYLANPDSDALSDFQNIKMITLAPELPGAIPLIKNSRAIVSLGHTGCDYETALRAIDAGTACLTHTFNAMPPLLHRAPGPIGAAAERGIYAQLICDGIHVHKAAVLALYRLFSSDRLILISDSMRAAGLPDGQYDLGGQDMTVKNGIARTADGHLAGSTAHLLDCVKTAIAFGIPETEAFHMASATPAALLGVKKGRIEPGFDADIMVVNEDLEPYCVIIAGEIQPDPAAAGKEGC